MFEQFMQMAPRERRRIFRSLSGGQRTTQPHCELKNLEQDI